MEESTEDVLILSDADECSIDDCSFHGNLNWGRDAGRFEDEEPDSDTITAEEVATDVENDWRPMRIGQHCGDMFWCNPMRSGVSFDTAIVPDHSFSAPPHEETPVEELPRVAATPRRLQAKAFFLTYSQSKLERSTLIRWINGQKPLRAILGMEYHQDGNTHWHLLIEYERQKEIRNQRFFDRDEEHPNIKVWKRSEGSTYEQWLSNHWKYSAKEDPTPYVVGEAPQVKEKRKREAKFQMAMQLARAEGVNSAMGFLEENCAFEVVTKYDQIVRALTAIRNKSARPRAPPRALCSFDRAPLIIDGWRVLYINGPTGCGKTAWARALLPEAAVVRHRDQLRDVDFSKGVIFDDFDVSHWPPTAVIHLLDWEESSGIDVKHGHVVIPENTRKIFTHNGEFNRWVSKDATEEQVEACRRRVHVVNVHTKLFS